MRLHLWGNTRDQERKKRRERVQHERGTDISQLSGLSAEENEMVADGDSKDGANKETNMIRSDNSASRRSHDRLANSNGRRPISAHGDKRIGGASINEPSYHPHTGSEADLRGGDESDDGQELTRNNGNGNQDDHDTGGDNDDGSDTSHLNHRRVGVFKDCSWCEDDSDFWPFASADPAGGEGGDGQPVASFYTTIHLQQTVQFRTTFHISILTTFPEETVFESPSSPKMPPTSPTKNISVTESISTSSHASSAFVSVSSETLSSHASTAETITSGATVPTQTYTSMKSTSMSSATLETKSHVSSSTTQEIGPDPTNTTDATNTAAKSSNQSVIIGMVIGGFIGGLAAMSFFVAVIWAVRRRWYATRQKRAESRCEGVEGGKDQQETQTQRPHWRWRHLLGNMRSKRKRMRECGTQAEYSKPELDAKDNWIACVYNPGSPRELNAVRDPQELLGDVPSRTCSLIGEKEISRGDV
ncbi:hypothetical protein GGS20DRAFT_533451 [Poronia punctata]|nr:hypothetical protein GGS20DRAFT_533451 [Poronia punctata]